MCHPSLYVTFSCHVGCFFPLSALTTTTPNVTTTTPNDTARMPPKPAPKSRKRTASNVNEAVTTKKPRNAKQPDPSSDDVAIEEDPGDRGGEEKTQGKGKRGGKGGGGGVGRAVVKRKGKAARYVPALIPLTAS